MTENRSIYRSSRTEAIEAIAARRAQDEVGDSEIERQMREDDRPTVLERNPAATRKLHEAAAALAASERELVQAEGRLRAASDVDREQAERDLKEKLNSYSEALYEGEPSRAAEVMAALMADRRNAAAPTDVHAMKAAVKRELNLESTLEAFGAAYPEIVADPNLAGMADSFYAAAVKEGKSAGEAFQYAGDSTRAYIKHLGAQLGMRDRGGHRERADASSEDASASSIIAEMAAQRPGALARSRGSDQ